MRRHFLYLHALARLLSIGQEQMIQEPTNVSRKRVGRLIRFGVVIAAAVTLLLVVLDTDRHPRTDDASVRANFIEIAPEVSGRLAKLPVKDNAYVKQGELLFVIDPRDYEYALRQALSDQENLEQRIIDTKRKIAAQNSAVEAASAAVHNSTTAIRTAGSGVDLAKATVSRAQASADAAEAQLKYATNDLHRIEPLLQKQYVTVDQVDQANTAVRIARGSYDAALAALSEAQAQETQALLREQEADDAATESRAKLGQSIHVIDTLDILESQRPGSCAARPRAMPRRSAFRCLRDQHEHFRGCVRSTGHSHVHAHRHAHVVGDRELSGGQGEKHPHWFHCRRVSHGTSRKKVHRASGEYWLRRVP
jgi:multidrug efflux system membrane fusion protein